MPAGLNIAAALLQTLLAVGQPSDTIPPDSIVPRSVGATHSLVPVFPGSLARLEAGDLTPGLEMVLQDTVRRRPKAIDYSPMYATRLRIHQIASFATLPLFVAEYFVGEDLLKNGRQASNFSRRAHGPLAGAIAGLFAVQTITGGWNMIEGWKDPNGRTRRTVHGLAMLLAGAGFVAVGATAPHIEEEGGRPGRGNAGLHKGLAIGSMSLSLASYLMMYLWKD